MSGLIEQSIRDLKKMKTNRLNEVISLNVYNILSKGQAKIAIGKINRYYNPMIETMKKKLIPAIVRKELQEFPSKRIKSEHHGGRKVPISDILNALASQENCDGEPWDQMVDAAEYIDFLEDILWKVRKSSVGKLVLSQIKQWMDYEKEMLVPSYRLERK